MHAVIRCAPWRLPIRSTSPRQGVRTLRAFGQRIPSAGGVLAPSLEGAVGGRTVLITGASSGIGKSTALKIGEAGGTVLLVARTEEKLARGAPTRSRTLGGVAYVHPCDLTDIDDIDRMASEVLEQHEAVDVLVNNAGKSIRRSVDRSYDRFHDYQRTMQLNYFGPVKLILDLLPTMRERRLGPHHQHLDDRAAGEHAAVRRLRRLEGGARRVLPLDGTRDHRRRRARDDDLHAARADADDRADEDLRPLPDAQPRARRRT